MLDWIPPILVRPLTILVVGGVMIAILNFRFARKTADNIMDASIGLTFFMIFTGGLMCALPLFICIQDGACFERDDFWAILLLIPIGPLSLVWSIDASGRKSSWSNNSLTTKKGFRPSKTTAWSEVAALERADMMQAWRIRYADGSGFGFHDYMHGSDRLATACLLRPHIRIPRRYEDLRDTLLMDAKT